MAARRRPRRAWQTAAVAADAPGAGPAHPEPRRTAAAPRRDGRVRGAARAARADRGAGIERAAGTPGSPRCRTAPRATSRRRSRSSPGNGSAGSRATPRSAIASRRSWRRGSAIRRPCRVLEPRTALAYERSELVADETAARVAALSAWRSGGARILVASVQALIQHTIAPDDLPESPLELRVGARVAQSTLLRGAARARLHAGARGRRPRRVRAPRRHRRRLPAVGGAAGPDRVVRRRDRLAARLRPDRPAHDRQGRARRAAPGVGVPRATRAAPTRCAHGSAPDREAAPGAARAGPRAARRRAGSGSAGAVPTANLAPRRSATPRRSGRRCSPPRRPSTTSRPRPCSSSTSRATSARPPSSCGARPTSAAPTCSRAGELPRDWPPTLLAAARLEAPAPRRADARADLGIRGGERDRRRRQVVGRPVRLARAAAAAGTRRADRRSGRSLARRGRRGSANPARGSSSPRTRRRGSPSCSRRPATPPASRTPSRPRRRPARSRVVDRSLNGGFTGGPDGLVFVTDRELFGNVRVRRPKAMRRVVPRDILERLTPGDLVVHIDHGIARYERMLRRELGHRRRARLPRARVPGPGPDLRAGRADRADLALLRRREPAPLEARRHRVAADEAARPQGGRRPRRGAARAVRVARARRPATPTRGDSPWQARDGGRVPVRGDRRPAPRRRRGQARHGGRSSRWTGSSSATSATARPRSRSGPRSRRSRTASRSRCSCPTTVLAAQHHATFGAAVRAVPGQGRAALAVRARRPSRTRPWQGLADGSVDLVIGTHRLLSKDVRFKDLGLVVVDEEQRFGVAAKERLKQLKREVDVLTLSATPIPRTLNLALAGVRDMSVIETPPEDRLPIQTRVAEASAGLVRDAILRELDRGGQVFYVHNRVETIEAQAEQLRKLLPDVRLVVGHGQMAEGQLESVMLTFAEGEADVLVCTTIIESGPRHPEREHDRHRPRRHARAGAALPAPRARRPIVAARLRVPAVPAPRADERGGAQAAPGDLQRLGARRRLPDRAVGPRDPRRRQHPRRGAVGPHGRGRVRPVLAAARGGGRGAQGGARESRSRAGRAAGRHRPAARGAPARRLRPRGGAEARAVPAARPRPHAGRRGRVPAGGHRPLRADADCRSSASPRSRSCGSPPRRSASPRCPARRASSWSASATACRAPRRCAC